MTRTSDSKYKNNHPTYQNVYLCTEWNDFNVFSKWILGQNNFNKIMTDEFHLDKDIIVKNNKIYCPDFCCIVPQRVNKLFTKRDSERGECPIGVRKKNQKYESRCSDNCESVYLGVYTSIEQAFGMYKQYKENVIKKVAQEEYSCGNIIKECYEAMMNYVVEMTD